MNLEVIRRWDGSAIGNLVERSTRYEAPGESGEFLV
jgi:hypothetical protein